MNPAPAELIAAIADDLPVAIWVARLPEGELVYANDAFTKTMGMVARDDVQVGGYAEPYGIYTRSGEQYPEERMPFVRAIRERKTVVVDDLMIHRGDGRRVAVRAIAKPMLDADDNIQYVAIAFFDVTAEVAALREKCDAQERLKQVVGNAPVILWGMDKHGVITLSEGHGLHAMGLKPGQLVGQSSLEIYKDTPGVLAVALRALAGEQFQVQQRVGPRTFSSDFAPLYDEAGEFVGVSAVTTDVSEQDHLRTQLIEADRMASLGTLAASVAHEINTPLAYISASLNHLSRELPRCSPSTPQLETLISLLEDARAGVERVNTIARDLHTLSRPQERQHPLDVVSVLESALRMTSNEISDRAHVVCNFERVPKVKANEARLAQVFLNLVMNAAQAFGEPQVIHNEIHLSVRSEQAKVIIEIADNGPGVDPALLPRIFEPFFTTKPEGLGTGLGLSICQNIVRGLGGEISVGNRDTGGAIARLVLPAAEPELRTANEVKEELIPSSPARVLIIDDNRSLGRVLKITRPGWCEFEVVDNGPAALTRLLTEGPYDVVLCDLMMPEMNGMELYEALRVQRPGAEHDLMFMTGGAYTQEARDFLARVPNPCFEKPFDFSKVIADILKQRACNGPNAS